MRSIVLGVAMVMLLPVLLGDCTKERNSGPPMPLVDLHEKAKVAFDESSQGDRGAVSSTLNEISSIWTSFRPAAVDAGASARDIEDVDRSIEESVAALSDSVIAEELGRAANNINGSLIDLFPLYGQRIPTELLALQFLGREALLDLRQFDFGGVTVDIDTMATVWTSGRDALHDLGKAAEADRIDLWLRTLRQQNDAANTEELMKDLEAGIRLLDEVEASFAVKPED